MTGVQTCALPIFDARALGGQRLLTEDRLPDRDGRSRQIANAAEPILREEALTAQSASIDLLSGATFTSEAYAESLQSALDQVRA